MKEYGVRRLPVLNKDGRLVGIISQTDVREAEPSDATSLSIYELNYLLAKLKIKRVMTEHVITVTPDTTIAEAARIMLEKKIGGLPVVENGQLVGIITESDIFRMVVKLYAS
jgi:CBS domain-containing protein